MTKQELLDFLKFNSNKPRYYTVYLNKKVLEQFAIGYYQDLSANRFIVYEVTERQQLHEKASFEREKDAIEELYEIVKFRCRIKSIPIQLDVSEIDAIGTSDKDLELLLIDGNLWLPDTEEKLNNYIYFLESKQYVERYGENFDKKVIHITFQYSPSDNGLAFLAAVQKVLQPTDMSLKVELPE
ncbi:Conserved hypothetical protein [Streptococcus sanguinis SK36]|uniref:Uncharacterized protein n=1 Tax=Streptococcus sanguinis (strain SK36) TaxID=388919 RepID=A3CNH1_STRSV|nr:DUF6572 domain-containing protein [Streptococcus sanguinis]ABN44726.1 Conserved hypothetical protein [Streptococcus sanguinis SK36]MBZ2055612.1 hypothetical protein [Streptococcus sanguinis]